MELIVKVTGELANNTYIIAKDGKAIIIDPPRDAQKVDQVLIDKKLTPVAMMLTHGHWDHYWGIKFFFDKYNIKTYMHKDDLWMVEDHYSELHGKTLDINTDVEFEFIKEGNLKIDDFNMQIIHTPGHSPGGICIYLKELNELITGDTLFKETVGRWDFTGGDKDTLLNSVSKKLYKLPNETIVRPGHGFKSTIGHEKMYNEEIRG